MTAAKTLIAMVDRLDNEIKSLKDQVQILRETLVSITKHRYAGSHYCENVAKNATRVLEATKTESK